MFHCALFNHATQRRHGFYIIETSFLQRFHDAVYCVCKIFYASDVNKTFRLQQLFKGDNYSKEETIRRNTVYLKKTVQFLTTQHKDGFYIIEASFLQRFHDASAGNTFRF